MDVDVADDSLAVDYEDGPFRVALFPFDPVFPGNRGEWRKIAQQGKRNSSQAFRPCLQAGDVIHTDTQDLGIESFELGQFSLVGRNLVRSNGGPGQGKEGKDYGAPAQQRFKPGLLIQVARQGKVRGFLPDFHFHFFPPITFAPVSLPRAGIKLLPQNVRKGWRKCMGIEPTCRLAQTAHWI